jgi:hypothetical protein
MIGYYVHHRGEGHLTRAASIAEQLGSERVTGLSSRPRPRAWAGPWVQLARDDVPPVGDAADPAAGGALHWAPLAHRGLRERMAQVAAWIRAAAPRLVVVDVSVEISVLIRSMGVPVVVMGMPGLRDDDAHQLGYRLAAAILAPWPAWADLLCGGEPWRDKTYEIGAISRFDGRRPEPSAVPAGDRRRRVLVLSGRGGTGLTAAELAAARRATPDWAWTVLGPPGDRWVADPWPLICGADVVVTHAGQNAVADIAAARRPAVVIPQVRPHDEQQVTAAALRSAGLATVCTSWPAAQDWPATLERAVARGGADWWRWTSGAGSRHAAEALDEVLGSADRSRLECAPL